MVLQFNNRKIGRLARKFEKIAFQVYRNGAEPSDSLLVRDRRMRAWFGASASTIAKGWTLLARGFGNELPQGATKERFLWALILLKSYCTEEVNAGRVGGVDEGTFRTWSWWFMEELSYCEEDVILWENRLIDDVGNSCLTSLDGVDCPCKGRVLPNGRPDPAFFCHKTKHSGLRYEVAIAIRSSNIVSIQGPYLCGRFNDLEIFRRTTRQRLGCNERALTDRGYRGEPRCATVDDMTHRNDQDFMIARVRNRNDRIKVMRALTTTFRHSIEEHGYCFRVSAILVQIAMEAGEELFDCREYHDDMSDDEVAALYPEI